MPLKDVSQTPEDDYFNPEGHWSVDPDLHNYEVTVTFNPQFFNIGSAYMEGVPVVIDNMKKWLDQLDICDSLFIVMEYQTNRMVHLHMCVSSTEPLPSSKRFDISKALTRMAGRNSFKSVIDSPSFETYLKKDLLANYERTKISHWQHYINY